MPRQGAQLDKFNEFNNLGFGIGVAFIFSKAFSFVIRFKLFTLKEVKK